MMKRAAQGNEAGESIEWCSMTVRVIE
jgi:hypothetical protein